MYIEIEDVDPDTYYALVNKNDEVCGVSLGSYITKNSETFRERNYRLTSLADNKVMDVMLNL